MTVYICLNKHEWSELMPKVRMACRRWGLALSAIPNFRWQSAYMTPTVHNETKPLSLPLTQIVLLTAVTLLVDDWYVNRRVIPSASVNQ